jgi:Flp pilus assembly pilin Flp
MKIDYALITALIVIAVIFGAGAVGRGLQSIFDTAASAISQENTDEKGSETGTKGNRASVLGKGLSGQDSGSQGGVG